MSSQKASRYKKLGTCEVAIEELEQSQQENYKASKLQKSISQEKQLLTEIELTTTEAYRVPSHCLHVSQRNSRFQWTIVIFLIQLYHVTELCTMVANPLHLRHYTTSTLINSHFSDTQCTKLMKILWQFD